MRWMAAPSPDSLRKTVLRSRSGNRRFPLWSTEHEAVVEHFQELLVNRVPDGDEHVPVLNLIEIDGAGDLGFWAFWERETEGTAHPVRGDVIGGRPFEFFWE